MCAIFVKLDDRKPFSFEAYQKYISRISGESLNKVMVAINKIAMGEGIEDGRSIRTDSTVVETDIHYPTNNSLIWDCIKTIDRLLKKLKESGVEIKVRSYKKQAKKTHNKINNTKQEDKREEEFKKQLKLLRSSINQAERALTATLPKTMEGWIEALAIMKELRDLLPKTEKVYNISWRHEILGKAVPNKEKIFSIYEDHTDIIVKGKREVEFGHKVNLATGRSNLILDCTILEGNPSDSTLYTNVIDRIHGNYGIVPRDMATDGGYASKDNARMAQRKGIVPKEIAIVGEQGSSGAQALLDVTRAGFRPHQVVALAARDRPSAIPLLLARAAIDDRATAYVCVRFACQRPTTDPQILADQLA